MKNGKLIPFGIAILLPIAVLLAFIFPGSASPGIFNEKRAYKDLVLQVELGPRIPGGEAHRMVGDWIISETQKNGWATETQETTINGSSLRNIISKRGNGPPVILLGAHYDTRKHADRDPQLAKRINPVPGANDGASGVAVLLELSRIIPKSFQPAVWLVFFDREDQGDIDNSNWIVGSQYFVQALKQDPDYVVIVDMVGDKNLNLYYEKNSNPEIMQSIWSTAAELGYSDYFIPSYKYSLMDDHTPFSQKGIKAIDIIDFDYPHWHTTADNLDNVSSNSLDIVGETLYQWLIKIEKDK